MDCKDAEDLFEPFLLGALDSSARRLMDSHLETCAACGLRLQDDGETVARLAFAVPQLEVPARVKRRVLSAIRGEAEIGRLSILSGYLLTLWPAFNTQLGPHVGKAVASVLVLGLILGGVWFNGRLNSVSRENDRMTDQLVAAAEREAYLTDMVQDQRYFNFETLRLSPPSEMYVNMLWSTGWSPGARGLMMLSRSKTRALLLVINLPALSRDQVYQVWLIKDGLKYGAGTFTVDSTGYGQAVIIPVAPFAEFDSMAITPEPVGGSATSPTGNDVLLGDL